MAICLYLFANMYCCIRQAIIEHNDFCKRTHEADNYDEKIDDIKPVSFGEVDWWRHGVHPQSHFQNKEK